MNKSQLIDRVAQQTNIAKIHSEAVLDAALAIIQKTVSKGDEVKLVGFGTFCRAKRAARKGQNPKTRTEIPIPATCIPKFRPGKTFRDSVK